MGVQVLKIVIGLALVTGFTVAFVAPQREQVMGSFATSLEGRTRGQRINALKAARALDGVTVPSGQTFSFNRSVGSWSPDRGYVLAPVSYDGQLVVDWGGGVCQTSSTLYNAALIAGMEIVQRHRHEWEPKYVPIGRDAAVAQTTIDLQFRNPYPWPVRIRTLAAESSIGFEIVGRTPGPMAQVTSVAHAGNAPSEVVKIDPRLKAGRRRVITRGRPGAYVTVYRTYRTGETAGQRELVSQDSYPAMDRIIAVGEWREGSTAW